MCAPSVGWSAPAGPPAPPGRGWRTARLAMILQPCELPRSATGPSPAARVHAARPSARSDMSRISRGCPLSPNPGRSGTKTRKSRAQVLGHRHHVAMRRSEPVDQDDRRRLGPRGLRVDGQAVHIRPSALERAFGVVLQWRPRSHLRLGRAIGARPQVEPRCFGRFLQMNAEFVTDAAHWAWSWRMSRDLDGTEVVVTGASSGIGRRSSRPIPACSCTACTTPARTG